MKSINDFDMKRKTRIYDYSEEQRQEFSRLVKPLENMVRSLLRKYDYIKDADRDDYYQECITYAWHRFHRFDGTRFNFSTWLYNTCIWAVLHYTRFLAKTQGHIRLYDNIPEWYMKAESNYHEQEFEALNRAVSDLPSNVKYAVNLFLSGESLRQKSLEDGKNDHYYSKLLEQARNIILSRRQRYFEDMRVLVRAKRIAPNKGIFNVGPSLPVEMRDLSGGYIKTYPSAAEAERDGFRKTAISRCLIGKGVSHNGYFWCRPGSFNPKLIERYANRSFSKARPIEQVTIDGIVVKEFSSSSFAGKQGYSETSINRALKQKGKVYKGYLWRYKSMAS